MNGDSEGPVWRRTLMIVIEDQLLRAKDDAAENAALTVDMLGRRIDHAVRAERERALVERRGEHVVDHELGTGIVCDVRDRSDVDHLQRRVGRRFQKECLGVFLDRLFPRIEIGAIDQRRCHPETRQPFLDDPAAGTEQRLCGDHVIAGSYQAHERGRDGRHAGRGRSRRFRPFERRHALLEHAHGRIGVARIDVTRDLAGETRLALLGGRIDVALGEEQRLRGLAELRAQRAGMNQPGFGAVALGRRGHHGLLLGLAHDLFRKPVSTFRGHAHGQQKTGRRNISAGLTRPRPFSDLFNVAASRPAQMTTG